MPAKLADDAICFVWRDDRILARAAEPPTLPTLADVVRLGIDGVRHYLGRYRGTDCIAFHVASDCAGHRRLAMARIALAVPAIAGGGARAGGPVVPDRRVGPQPPLLRPLRRGDARQARRAREGMPGVRPRRLSAHFAGDDGAGHARPRAAAGARQSLPRGDVQRAGRIRRGGRVDRGLHSSRSARGSRRRGARPLAISPASRGRSRTR